ncbi:MAG TPA: glycosyltransferase family 4 protein [Planctomycetota bacterium]|nr:glycosyltransferase family 4 protein [Planctomycetota bacterium]
MSSATPGRTVAFLIDRWEPERGGAERALAALAKHLGERGHRVLAFARRASPGAPGEFHAVATGGWSRKSRERALARALTAAAREAGADVTIGMRHLEEVDVFWPHAGAHARGLEAREAARRRPGSAAAAGEAGSDEDASEPAGRHALFCELERQLCEGGGAGRIVCVSKLVADELRELYPSSAPRLELVPNGIDLEHFSLAARAERGAALRAELGLQSSTPLIAFLAHDAELKGLPTLLDALVLQARPDVQLLIAGPRPLERWKRRAERALGASRVHAFESIDAAAALSAADLLAHPTWRDTSGLVLLEAQAVGTPVVTTRRAGDASVVREGVSGTVLADPGDALALAGAITRWLERAKQGKVDRAAVRAAVAHRGLDTWLAAMETIVLAASDSRRLAARE